VPRAFCGIHGRVRDGGGLTVPSHTDGIIEGQAEIDQEFYLALQGEDDLGMVVRAHIHVEHTVRTFITAAAPAPTHVKFSAMDYDATVRLALVLGLNSEFQGALGALGALRNKFSHRLDTRIGEEEANNLYAALGAVAKRVVQQSYQQVQRDEPGKHVDTFKNLVPRDRLLLCLIALRGGILIEVVRALGKLDEISSKSLGPVNNPKK
jgi:hypothetical protein